MRARRDGAFRALDEHAMAAALAPEEEMQNRAGRIHATIEMMMTSMEQLTAEHNAMAALEAKLAASQAAGSGNSLREQAGRLLFQ